MLSNRLSLLAGSLGVLVCTMSAPAHADRAMTGYAAFVRFTTQGSQSCIAEAVGGALNSCSSTQNYMVFELPIETSTSPVLYNITARSFGTANASFTCFAVAMSPTAQSATFGNGNTFAASGIDTKSFAVVVPAGHALRLQCQNVPRNKGILSIRYTPIAES